MKIRDKINLSSLHIYFFYIFLFLIPLQARKVFFTDYSFYSGSFTEYTTYFLYVSDVFLFLAVLFWLVFNKKLIKCQKTIELNIISGASDTVKSSKVWLILLIFIDWIIINTAINNKYLEISAFQIIKFVELSFLFVYIYYNLKNKKELITSLLVVSTAGFLQSIIAIYQFSFQHSLFESPLLHKIIGETIIGSNLPGVAKIVFGGEKIARAYGTFPHPNILGGFLIFSIMLSIYLYLEHKNYILSSSVKLCLFLNQYLKKLKRSLFLPIFKRSSYNNFNKCGLHKKAANYSDLNYDTYDYNCQYKNVASILWAIFVFIQFVGLIFSFSRSAWMGFFITASILLIFYSHNLLKNIIVSRETILKFRLFRFLRSAFDASFFIRYYNKNENLSFFILFTALLTFFLIIYSPLINARLDSELFYPNDNTYLNYNYDSRNFYNNVSRETIRENLLMGSGIGTSIFQINKYLEENNIDYNPRYWQYQPAHNVYLLIMSEIGLVGLVLFLLFIVYLISNSVKKSSKLLNLIWEPLKNDQKALFQKFNLAHLLDSLFRGNDKRGVFQTFLSRNKSEIVSRETIFKVGGKSIAQVILANNQNNVSRETLFSPATKLNYYLLSVLAAFSFMWLFDHYFWTLQQGQLTLWLVLGIMLASNNKD